MRSARSANSTSPETPNAAAGAEMEKKGSANLEPSRRSSHVRRCSCPRPHTVDTEEGVVRKHGLDDSAQLCAARRHFALKVLAKYFIRAEHACGNKDTENLSRSKSFDSPPGPAMMVQSSWPARTGGHAIKIVHVAPPLLGGLVQLSRAVLQVPDAGTLQGLLSFRRKWVNQHVELITPCPEK